MLAHALPLRAASPLSQLSGKQKNNNTGSWKGLSSSVEECLCVCVCMKVLCLNTPVRNSTIDPPRNAHETLACCILLQRAAHWLFLSLSLSPHYISIPPTPSIPHPWYPFYREWCHPWACNCQHNCWNFCQDFTCEQKMQASLNFHML